MNNFLKDLRNFPGGSLAGGTECQAAANANKKRRPSSWVRRTGGW